MDALEEPPSDSYYTNSGVSRLPLKTFCFGNKEGGDSCARQRPVITHLIAVVDNWPTSLVAKLCENPAQLWFMAVTVMCGLCVCVVCVCVSSCVVCVCVCAVYVCLHTFNCQYVIVNCVFQFLIL